MDFVCRYGGEEFAVILPYTDRKETFLIAERLRENIAKHTFFKEEVQPNKCITASIGLASFPEDGDSPSKLIAHSDYALYEAKNKGKNNTCG